MPLPTKVQPLPQTPGLVAKPRVTQLDIARAAGVHNTTVSLALRNCPSISEATRLRIQSLAAELGYCPDPALRALVAYRKNLVVGRRTETVAYVTHGTTRWGWRDVPSAAQQFAGAQRKAAESGYQLEHFWLGEAGLSPRRLSNMLFHRGITGVLFASFEAGADEPFDFEWERFSAVKLGTLSHLPALHQVSANPTGDVRLAVRQALAAGYQRVGLVLPADLDEAADLAWSISFALVQRHLSLPQIPVLRLGAALDSGLSTRQDDAGRLAAWFAKHQPDVLLGACATARDTLPALRLRVPHDVAFIELLATGDNPDLAGVRQHGEQVGEVGFEVLVHQLQQNLHGVPAVPTTTLVEGVWCDGASLPGPQVPPWREPQNALPAASKTAETAA